MKFVSLSRYLIFTTLAIGDELLACRTTPAEAARTAHQAMLGNHQEHKGMRLPSLGLTSTAVHDRAWPSGTVACRTTIAMTSKSRGSSDVRVDDLLQRARWLQDGCLFHAVVGIPSLSSSVRARLSCAAVALWRHPDLAKGSRQDMFAFALVCLLDCGTLHQA